MIRKIINKFLLLFLMSFAIVGCQMRGPSIILDNDFATTEADTATKLTSEYHDINSPKTAVKRAWTVPNGYTSVIDFEDVYYSKFVDYGDYSSYSYEYEFDVYMDYDSNLGSNPTTSITYHNLIGFAANYVLDEDMTTTEFGSSTMGYPIVANSNATYGRGDLYPWNSNFATQTMCCLLFENNSPYNYSLAWTFRNVIAGTSSYTMSWQENAGHLGSEYHVSHGYSATTSTDNYTCSSYSNTYIWFFNFNGMPNLALYGLSIRQLDTTLFGNQFNSTNSQIETTSYNDGANIGYNAGLIEGFDEGLIEGTTNRSFVNYLNTIATGMNAFLTINIFPGITLGFLIFFPAILALIIGIVRLMKGQ